LPKVLDIAYVCRSCGFSPDEPKSMICKCGGELRGEGPGVTGTRDGFGIGRKFYHTDNNGSREITTWREWEKFGYKDAISATNNKTIAKMAKDKMKRIKAKGGRSML